MNSFFMVAQIILVLSLSVLAVYLVVVLTKVRAILGHLETDVKEISVRVIPVLENMEVITSKLRSITVNVDDQMTIVKSSVQSFKHIADNIEEFERRIQDQVEAPVLEVAGIIGTVVRGVAAFINRLRG
ncbi:MAG TPA: hypothetical protein VMM58_00630 [Bacteroidota bacterium]|nr:hypothetical protein [Bacteroidota bacterium]